MTRPSPILVDIQEFSDPLRGALFVAACGAHVPFPVQRVFFMPDLPEGGHRGGHAHRRCSQFLICLGGEVEASVAWLDGEQDFQLASPRQGLYLPPLCWLDIRVRRAASSFLVLASDLYDAADYIHDRREFEVIRGRGR